MSTYPPTGVVPKHRYGWKRSLPGIKYPYADTGGLEVAAEVDPRKQMPPVFDQGELGSCTANATAACFQYDSIIDGKDCGELSRLWIYYFERAIEHTLDQGDCGAMGHDAFTVAHHGVPAETLWPYKITDFEDRPGSCFPRSYTLTKTVHSVPQLKSMVQQVLSNKQTIAFGFTVYESFENQWATPGVMPMPKPEEEVLGGHEILAIGYTKTHPNHVLCRNSWGTHWGLGGYFFFPLEGFLDPNMTGDLRTIVRPA